MRASMEALNGRGEPDYGEDTPVGMLPPIKQRVEALIKQARGSVGFIRNNNVDYAHPTYVSELPRLLEEAVALLEETYKDKY